MGGHSLDLLVSFEMTRYYTNMWRRLWARQLRFLYGIVAFNIRLISGHIGGIIDIVDRAKGENSNDSSRVLYICYPDQQSEQLRVVGEKARSRLRLRLEVGLVIFWILQYHWLLPRKRSHSFYWIFQISKSCLLPSFWINIEIAMGIILSESGALGNSRRWHSTDSISLHCISLADLVLTETWERYFGCPDKMMARFFFGFLSIQGGVESHKIARDRGG